jgi:hypothetical protein
MSLLKQRRFFLYSWFKNTSNYSNYTIISGTLYVKFTALLYNVHWYTVCGPPMCRFF